MASRFSISAVFKAIDQLTAPVRKMTLENKKFTNAIKRDFAKAQRSVANFGSSIKKHLVTGLKTAAIIGVGALIIGLGIAAKQFIEFDQAITSASAKFKGLNLATEEGQKTLQALKDAAREVGATTEFSATQAAAGLDFLAMAGFSAEQAIVSLGPAVDLATVAGIDLARSTDIASDSLGAFGLMTDDTNQLQKNFIRLNDVMATTMTATNTSIEDMFEAYKKGAPVFTSTGQTLESFNALVGAMANSTLKGGEAGTQLRNIMLRLAKPTKESADLMKDMGIKTADSEGNFLDIIDILKQFEVATKDMGTQQRAAALATVFGSRNITGLNILLQEGTDNLSAFRDELINSGGATKEMADIMRQSLQNRIKTLQSSLIETGFKFIEAFEKNGGAALEFITNAIQKFDPAPIIIGIKNVAKIFVKFFQIIKPFAPFIIGIIIAWQAYQKALLVAAAAQAILNFVMSANPIGLTIIAIGLLIGIIYLLIKNWDQVKIAIMNAVKISLEWLALMGEKIVDLWDKFKGLALIINAPFVIIVEVLRSIIEHWDEIKKGFAEGGILGGIMAIGKAIISGILAPMQSLLELVSKVPGIGNLAAGGAEKLAQLREGLFESTDPATAPLTPSERSSLIREERTDTAELTINDKTGNAEITKNSNSDAIRLKLQSSGAF